MSNKLFIQEKQVIVNGLDFKSPPFDIEFVIGFDTNSDSNNGTIEIFNLSRESINQIEKDEKIVVKAGYEGDIGVVIAGDIKKVGNRWEGQDRITRMTVAEDVNKWLNKTINMTWRKNIQVERVVRDIISVLGLSVGGLKIPNVRYESGKTFTTTCKKALEQIANDFNLKLYTSRGTIHMLPDMESVEKVIRISHGTGLIEGVEKDDDKYHTKTLLDYRIKPDTILDIESQEMPGKYRVVDGEHISSGDSFFTEVVMKKYE